MVEQILGEEPNVVAPGGGGGYMLWGGAGRAAATGAAGRAGFGVVITGGTRGLGRAMAESHLRAGDRVLIVGRDRTRLERTLEDLSSCAKAGGGLIRGAVCDVGDAAQVEKLGRTALDDLGEIDGFICNAASNGYLYENLVDTPVEKLQEVVQTNALGVLLCSREAMRIMQAQGDRGGDLFLLTGAGSDGTATSLYSSYGFTKAGLPQLAASLRKETEGSAIGVHTLSPGLVFTDLLVGGEDKFGQMGNFAVNLIGEDADTVAAEVVPQVREVLEVGNGPRKGRDLKYLTPDKIIAKLSGRLLRKEGKARFYNEDEIWF